MGGDTGANPSPPENSEAAVAGACAEDLHAAFCEEHAAGNKGATYRAAADRVGVPHQHIGDWCNPVSGRLPKAHKIDLLPVGVALRYHRKRLARLENIVHARAPKSLTHTTFDAVATSGRLAEVVGEAVADGEIDAREDARIEAVYCQMEANIAAGRAALAAARAKRGGR